MKLIFVCPTYGAGESAPIKAERARRVAIMNAACHGHEWLGDCSRDREGWEATRNNSVQEIVNNHDYPDEASVFWCDADVRLPFDSISRLAQYGYDFITGIYFQRNKPHRPVVATFNGSSFHFIGRWPENTIIPIDGCGFGCVLTSLRMLRKMDAPWFKFEKFSEDFDFCLKAKRAGFDLFCDTGVICGHFKDAEEAGYEDYKRENVGIFGGKDGTEFAGFSSERPTGDLALSRG